jgi:type I restriction enzyme M protein
MIDKMNAKDANLISLSHPDPLQVGEGEEVKVGARAAIIRTVEIHVPPKLLANARELRKNQTKAEELLWLLLRDRKLNNLKFRRQHPLSVGFIIDFYCAKQKLGIEVDGGYHNNKEQQKRDTERTKIINKYGIKIIRFSNDNILNNTESILEEILRSALQSPLQTGEG